MLRRRLLVSIHTTALSAACAPLRLARAQAEPPRLALVIGNALYPEVPLNNPVNDANLIAKTLQIGRAHV